MRTLGFFGTLCFLSALSALACSSSSETSSDGGNDGMSSDGTRPDATKPGEGGKSDGPADSGVSDGSKDGASDGPGEGGDGGAPYLVSLSVTSTDDASPGLALTPTFSPDVFDYYVRCGAGPNALTVSMTASPGAESLLTQPTKSPSLPSQTLSVSAAENGAIVAEATRGSESTAYWVRCLPHDFPMLFFTPHPEAGTVTPGYYLVGNYYIFHDEGPYAIVLDTRGVPVWYARASNAITGVSDVSSLVPGAISFKSNNQGIDNPFRVLDLDSGADGIVTAEYLDLHDLQLMSNGHYVVITEGLLTGIDLTGLSIPLEDGGVLTFGNNSTIVNCDVVELDPKTNEVVWTWDAFKHFDPLADLTFLNPGVLVAGTDIVQPYHCNSIAVDAHDNLLVSGRHMDSIFYIEHPSGRVLWKMGGAKASRDNAVYVNVDDPFYRQHDARLQASWKYTCTGGTGEVSVYDDETDTDGGNPARAVAYDVTVPLPSQSDGGIVEDCGAFADAGGGKATAVKSWQYAYTEEVAATGSFRILPDGSRTIGWGFGPLVFSEVTLAGADLLDFHMTPGDSSYRAIKVPLSAFDLNVLRSTAGATVATIYDAGHD